LPTTSTPGVTNVAFELSGFAKVEQSDVTVQLGRTFEINTQLKVGALTEVVTGHR
jgi:hypothetical protein